MHNPMKSFRAVTYNSSAPYYRLWLVRIRPLSLQLNVDRDYIIIISSSSIIGAVMFTILRFDEKMAESYFMSVEA